MEANEPNIHAYTDVMMKKAHLDWEMECLQTKIKCKNEENSKLENQIYERKNELEKLRKSVSASCEREEKVKNNINMLRNSRAISDGLLMSMKQQLRILEEKRKETKTVRKNIIEKYSKLFESHVKIYSTLPWVKKINELNISVQNRRICLDILKLKYSSFKRKIILFHRIQDQRKVVAITQLAKCLVARNNLQKEVEGLSSKLKKFQSRIILLEEEKIKLQEKIDLKIKEALNEARGRVVKKHVGEGSGEKHPITAAPAEVGIPLGTNLKTTNESIFSRLGLSVPLSMKRLLMSTSRILDRVNGQMEEHSKRIDDPGVEKFSPVQEKSTTSEVKRDQQTVEGRVRVLELAHGTKEKDLKKKNVTVTEKFNRVENKSSASKVQKDKQIVEGEGLSASHGFKRLSAAKSNIPEKIPHLMEFTQKNIDPAVEQEKVQASPEKVRVSDKEESEVMQFETASEPASTDKATIQTETKEKERNTEQTNQKNKNSRRIMQQGPNLETSSIQVSETLKNYISGNVQNAPLPEETLQDNANESISKTIAPKKNVTPVNFSKDTNAEKDIQPQKQAIMQIDSTEETLQDKTVLNEPEMENSNLSVLDNISVVSSTFTNENRNQMVKSPDFLNRIPQEYCFSPLYSPSKADSISDISLVKDAKSPSNNFPATSIASPLFAMDTQPKAGSSSDFSSFFGAGSPKKSENSSKNFFQLFG